MVSQEHWSCTVCSRLFCSLSTVAHCWGSWVPLICQDREEGKLYCHLPEIEGGGEEAKNSIKEAPAKRFMYTMSLTSEESLTKWLAFYRLGNEDAEKVMHLLNK